MEKALNVNDVFQAAQNAAENYDTNAALMHLRKLADFALDFYIEQWKLTDSYCQLQKDPRNQGQSDSVVKMFAFRKGVGFFNGSYKRDLLLFLELARRTGNKGVHEMAEYPLYYAQFLLDFYRSKVMKRLEKDMRISNGQEDFRDVTAEIAGRRFTLCSCITEAYASARADRDDTPLCCDIGEPQAWERFTAEADGKGRVFLRAFNGCYLSVRLDKDKDLPPVCATAQNAQGWEAFRIYRTGDAYCIRAEQNQRWLSCREDMENKPVVASREQVQLWECFDIQFTGE